MDNYSKVNLIPFFLDIFFTINHYHSTQYLGLQHLYLQQVQFCNPVEVIIVKEVGNSHNLLKNLIEIMVKKVMEFVELQT